MASASRSPGQEVRRSRLGPRRRDQLSAGGIEGNERLTTTTGLLLIVLLGALGITIVFIGRLLWEHLFIGLVLIGPVILKLLSTGYRFAKYYAGNPVYVRRGPPWTPLRMIAPIVVLSTIVVLATGVVLLFVGPNGREPWFLLHKASFIVWIAFTALHVLGHLPELARLLGLRSDLLDLAGLRTDLGPRERSPSGLGESRALPGRPAPLRGRAGRAAGIGLAVTVGLAIALALIPDYGTWTAGAAAALPH